jgi:hypothetical protein
MIFDIQDTNRSVEFALFVNLCQDGTEAYWQSAPGKAMMGSKIRCFRRRQNASRAGPGRGPPLYPELVRRTFVKADLHRSRHWSIIYCYRILVYTAHICIKNDKIMNKNYALTPFLYTSCGKEDIGIHSTNSYNSTKTVYHLPLWHLIYIVRNKPWYGLLIKRLVWNLLDQITSLNLKHIKTCEVPPLVAQLLASKIIHLSCHLYKLVSKSNGSDWGWRDMAGC